MPSKAILASLLASTLICAAAAAQQAPTTNQPAANTPAARAAVGMKHLGEWRASKMIGLRVYNQQNESIGDINEILFDQSGKVTGYVVGVGGFLGMGEHDVLLKPEEVKFVNDAVKASRTTTNPPPASTTGSATAPRNQDAPARPARAADEKWYPDHAVVNATKDQLKTMPQFRYSNYN
jgi:sporulation protein YlmC with PRC-barrel domain